MTNSTMNLQELLEETTDPDFLREMIGFPAQRLNQRNGYRDRDWHTQGRNRRAPHSKTRGSKCE